MQLKVATLVLIIDFFWLLVQLLYVQTVQLHLFMQQQQMAIDGFYLEILKK